jgi:hypothetical protein
MTGQCAHLDHVRDVEPLDATTVRGMPADEQPVGASAPLPNMRSRRLLRRLTQQARHETFSCHAAPDNEELRGRRELAVVLRRRGVPAVGADRQSRLVLSARMRRNGAGATDGTLPAPAAAPYLTSGLTHQSRKK